MASTLRRITDNWKLKTLAFALAVLLWVVVSAEQVTTNWIWVPLEVQVADDDYEISRAELPRDVQVRFSGAGRDLLDLAVRRPPLRLTVSEVADEAGVFSLDPRMVQVPAQIPVNALDVRPGTLRLEFTRMEDRIVPVRVRLIQPTEPGWTLVEPVVPEPDRVRVRGPLTRMVGITELLTEPITLNPGEASFDRVVRLDTTALQGLQVSTRQVRVAGRIEPVVERTIPGVPVDLGPGVTVLPERVDVRLRGPESAVAAVEPGLFRVVVAIAEIPSLIPVGGISVPLRVDGLRLGIEANVSPAEVRLYSVQPSVGAAEPPVPPADTLSLDATADP